MIKFEDFNKLDLKVGEVVAVRDNQTEINCGEKTLSTKVSFGTNVGDKIIVGAIKDELVIPLVGGKHPLTPDQDMSAGDSVS